MRLTCSKVIAMEIAPTDRLIDIIDRFQQRYPLLGLRFYRSGHQSGQASAQRDAIEDEDILLSELNPKLEGGELPLDEQTTVEKLEADFDRCFGLHVQVFRKAGKSWIQTTNTDNWTLARQQAIAAETEDFFKNIRR